MKKVVTPAVMVITLLGVIIWQLFSSTTSYYLVSVAILILSMLPFLISFERSDKSASELAILAGITALAVAGRAVFYLVPQVKPIAAVVAVGGVCLGAKKGYIIGCFSMFISNFIFGQGAWTPFQMVGMGFVGLIFAAVFNKIKCNRISLCIVGFLSVFVVYGFIVDTSSVLFLSTDLDVKSALAVYLSGLPFNLTFAASTAVFLFVFGEQLVKKINRITIKYGIDNYG